MTPSETTAETDDYKPHDMDWGPESLLESYQNWVNKDVRYKDATYAALGLAGETGEVLEAVKKMYRQYEDNWDYMMKDGEYDHLVEELGDVLWYLTRLTTLVGSSLEEIMELNQEKLNARRANQPA